MLVLAAANFLSGRCSAPQSDSDLTLCPLPDNKFNPLLFTETRRTPADRPATDAAAAEEQSNKFVQLWPPFTDVFASPSRRRPHGQHSNAALGFRARACAGQRDQFPLILIS